MAMLSSPFLSLLLDKIGMRNKISSNFLIMNSLTIAIGYATYMHLFCNLFYESV